LPPTSGRPGGHGWPLRSAPPAGFEPAPCGLEVALSPCLRGSGERLGGEPTKQRSSSGEAGRRERAGANDGEAGKYRPTLRCPRRCRSIRGGGGVAPPEGVPGSEADRGAYVPYPGPCRARHCLHGDARRPGDTSRRSPSRGLPPAWTRAEHADFGGTQPKDPVPKSCCGETLGRSDPLNRGRRMMVAGRRSTLRRSSGRLLEEAPRLIHQVVKTLVAAVDELTGEPHSVLDLLEREQR
jgi:hypothetical protein